MLWLKVLSSTPIALEKGQKVQKVQQIGKKRHKNLKAVKSAWTKVNFRRANKNRNGILLPKLF